MSLLSRNKFRESVFQRDNCKCVVCGENAVDAHHIIGRRLFDDGGYYLDNGASLCQKHHLEAEMTVLSCEDIRELCGIENIIIPEHFYSDLNYDKWGNIILPTGIRLKGELFKDGSVQKILGKGNVLQYFSKYVKYPRTYHLPWSDVLKDDRQMEDDSNFDGKEVVATLKMDGENTTFYNDYIHARSLSNDSHPTRDWVKGLWSRVGYLLDDNMRICGENLYAVHSLKYENLESFFYMFSIWEDNICLSWKETEEYAGILGLNIVPVMYKGIYCRDKIQENFKEHEDSHEGYVVRLADSFTYQDFRKSVGKYVSKSFRDKLNNSHGNWISKKIEKNSLKTKKDGTGI